MSQDEPKPQESKRPWYKKKRFLLPIGFLILISALTSTSEDSETNKSSSSSSESSPAPVESSKEVETEEYSEYGIYSDEQKEFIEIVEQATSVIRDAETELQESVALRKRDDDLCALLGDRTAINWTGKITEVGANGEGKAHVEIELADNVRVKTWNNALSDIGDNTLISPSSSFFNNLVSMSEDTIVTWSGKFLSGNDFCLKKANLTNIFYASDPQFIVKFSNIKATKG